MTFKLNQPVKIKATQSGKAYGVVDTMDGIFYRLKNNMGLYFNHALLPVESNNITPKDKRAILASIKALRFGIYKHKGEYIYSENLQDLMANIETLDYVETKDSQFIL